MSSPSMTDGHLADGNRVSNAIVQPEPTPPTLSAPRATGSSEEEYDTSNPRRGMAIILHHENFKLMSKRTGSSRDCSAAVTVLTNMQFDVRVYEDLPFAQLCDVLSDLASEDHSDADCLLVMIMTHGDDDVLYAFDMPYKVDVLFKHFMGDSCPTLLGKPKLFFVQACRGTAFDKGVQLGCGVVDKDCFSSNKYVIPTTADLLVMYSSYQGHVSWRNPVGGSWFIQALCAELELNWRHMELLQLLTAVSRRVAYDYQSNVPQSGSMDAMKQMPSIVSMLTKLVYFPFKKQMQQ
uniref:Caspase n=1 Tax=Anopheles stephensi TaxID=30069 RepID=A0A182YKQ1_ANOST